ncbi:MAG: 30S ribosome-binding factor RbfA [Candidatus Omnitrophica bacterium]|nr:30S ribosome-binding factor RbfA [Candidatus Omnitrophota bacterium]
MMGRVDKVAEAVRQEVSIIIHDKLKDPRLGFVTITRVEMAPDLRLARVFFSVLGKDEEHKKTKQALDSSLGFIRKLVSERINLKFAPEILFKEDRSTEYSVRIEQVLNEIKEINEPKKSSRSRKKT